MPFVTRVTTMPTLGKISELEQIVLVDQTGPSGTFGVGQGVALCIGETLKGPFTPTEVQSQGDLESIYGGVSNLISQNSAAVVSATQDGSGVGYEGNVLVQLLGKTFNRLAILRVNTNMVTTTDPSTAAIAYLKFTVTVHANEQASNLTTVDILIPAGTRFADDVIGSATTVIALSQDILIPKGSAVVANEIDITVTKLAQDSGTGQLYVPTAASGVTASMGATAFFVKGVTAAIAAIDTAIDTTLPNVQSTIKATGISTANASNAATAIYVPGTNAAANIVDKLELQYTNAIDSTVSTAGVLEDVTAIWSARNDKAVATYTIRQKLGEAARDASAVGRGRVACMANLPAQTTSATAQTAAIAVATAMQSALSTDADRALVCFPYVYVYSSTLGKNVLVSPAGFKAALCVNLPEEYQTSVANTYLGGIQSFEPIVATTPPLRAGYVAFKAGGVSALLNDRSAGWWFQSAVTAVNSTTYPTRQFDNRRRMADFIQDTIAGIAAGYSKLPATTERVDALVGEIEGFLSSLVSESNPAQQRIESFLVDAKSANTSALTAAGCWTFVIKVRMLSDLNYLVFQTQIGPTVEVTQTA